MIEPPTPLPFLALICFTSLHFVSLGRFAHSWCITVRCALRAYVLVWFIPVPGPVWVLSWSCCLDWIGLQFENGKGRIIIIDSQRPPLLLLPGVLMSVYKDSCLLLCFLLCWFFLLFLFFCCARCAALLFSCVGSLLYFSLSGIPWAAFCLFSRCDATIPFPQ